MRLFATSDLHTDYKDNFRWLAEISDRDYRNDALIVAGDISDRLPIIRETLELLRACAFLAKNASIRLSFHPDQFVLLGRWGELSRR